MKYVMGLDIGIKSIGWAVINLEKNRIEDLGVRLFEAAERPKDGGAVNEKRREYRSLRKRLKRKKVRMDKIKELFIKYNLIDKDNVASLYILSKEDTDVWKLRLEALDRKLTNREFARVLTAIAKRRGYKSNRKIEEIDEKSENGKLTKAIKLNKLYMESNGYRTVGEMFAKDEKYLVSKRNKGGQYNNCIDRNELVEEIKIIFEKQREYGNALASENFEAEYLEVFNWQKAFMSAELIRKMIGKCTFEKEEPRASKNSYTFERFMLLQKVNNLSYTLKGEKIYLTEDDKKKIIDQAYLVKSGIKYSKIRKDLNLPEEAVFTGLNYYQKLIKKEDGSYEKMPYEEIVKKTEESAIFVKLVGYHEIKSVLNDCREKERILKDYDLLDKIAEVLTLNKTDVTLTEELKKLELDNCTISALLKINFTKFGHLSYKTMKKILPYLEEGMQYDKACVLAGYNFKNDDENPKYKLPIIPKEDIRNPVVYRAVTQTRKVINAVIDKYGSPFEIHIEVARELTKSFKDRKKTEKDQLENRAMNDNLKKDIEEHFGIKAKPVDMLKKKLYHEQGGKSAYSLNPIDYNRLFENGYVEIDHAIPFSRSFNDSYNNKVLVLSRENQEKRNMTPYEFLSENGKWEEYEAWVKSTYRNNFKKRENLLVKNFNSEKENEWIERNLVDTKYIARYMSNFVKKNLLFDNHGEKENRIKVKTIVGAATTALRHYWGIPAKNRAESDLHHAEDAVIIACATDSFQKKIREYSKEKELYYPNKNGEYFDPSTGEIVDVKYKTHEMGRPWENFKEELEARMSQNPVHDLKYGNFTNYNDVDIEKVKPIFVSRMPNRKISGQAHEETIYSLKHNKDNGVVTVKKPLNRISKAEIEMVINKEECKELYRSDKDLYDRIYQRLLMYDFKSEKAFPNDFEFRKFSAKGEGPLVRTIKVPSVLNAGVEVQKGLAANGNMVRVDVFTKDDKYYLVPIYVAHMVKDKLPNKAIKANKPENEWLEMDKNYIFKFSLYPNDMIVIKKKKEEPIYCYYNSTHRNTGAINVILHDGSKRIEGIGIQNLDIFEKYEVDVLGNYHKVKKEKRKGGKNNKK